jgi:putative peptidoglycan lipid II flippase
MTLASNITGFLRQLIFAWIYGAGQAMDAYLIATVLSQMVFASANTAVSTTLIPIYTELKQASEEDAEQFLRAISGLVTAFTAIAGFALYLGAPLLVRLLAPGFGPAEARLAALLLRVMMPSLVFMGLSSVAVGFLQTRAVFGPPAAIYIPRNIVLIVLAAWIGHRFGISVLAWGSLLGAILQLYVVALPLRRLGSSLRLAWQPLHPGIRTMIHRLPGVFANYFMYSAALVVDRVLASGLPAGMISALNYAQLLINFPLGLAAALATAIFPTFSEMAAAQEGTQLSHALRTALRLLVFLVAPISLFTIFLREPLVALVYAHGAFGTRAIVDTAYALLFFSVGMISMAMNGVLSRAAFALGKTRVLYSSAGLAVGTTIVMDLILVHPLQQGGLALGTTLGSWAGTLVLLLFLSRRLEGFRVGPIISDILWSSALSLIAYGAAYLAYLRWHGPTLPHGLVHLALLLIATFIVGTLLYLALQRLVGPMRGNLQRAIREGRRAFNA